MTDEAAEAWASAAAALNLADFVLTTLLFSRGVPELNPLMGFFLRRGFRWFFAAKVGALVPIYALAYSKKGRGALPYLAGWYASVVAQSVAFLAFG